MCQLDWRIYFLIEHRRLYHWRMHAMKQMQLTHAYNTSCVCANACGACSYICANDPSVIEFGAHVIAVGSLWLGVYGRMMVWGVVGFVWCFFFLKVTKSYCSNTFVMFLVFYVFEQLCYVSISLLYYYIFLCYVLCL